jgi:signal transduction histidine kinase
MTRSRLHRLITGSLTLLTLLILGDSLMTIDSAVVGARLLELVVFALLTALAVLLSVPLSGGQLSIAHAVGMLAFLSLPPDTAPAMTVMIAAGGFLGGLLQLQLQPALYPRVTREPHWQQVIYITARLTVAFFVAGRVYIDFLGAPLPIDSESLRLSSAPLLLYAFLYAVLYFVLFTLQIGTEPRETRQTLDTNKLSLAIIVLLPVPFAFLGATVARTDDSLTAFVILVIGAVLIISGLYALNRTQQQLRRQLDEMRSISVATQAMRSNLELDSLLRTAYVQVSQLLDASHFTVALEYGDGQHLGYPLVIRDGDEVQQAEPPDDYALIRHVIQTRAPLLLRDDVRSQALELGLQPPQTPVQSWLGVPVGTGDRAPGAFVVLSYGTQRFDQDDLRLLNIIVASTSIALENARLYRQKSTRAEQLATLNQVTALLTGTLAPNEVLDIIVSSASTITEANAVGVFLFTEDDHSGRSLRLVRHAGLSETFTQQPPSPVISTDIYQTDERYLKPQALVINSISRHETFPHQTRQRLLDEGKQALIEIPLMIGTSNLGVLVLYFDKVHDFVSEHIDLIQAFGTQAAQAINNARTFASTDKALEQRIEQLYALAQMGRLLNATLDTQKIYSIVLSYATDATRVPRGAVVLQHENGRVSVPAQRGYPEQMFKEPDFLMRGIIGRVLQSGQTKRIGDVRTETSYLPLTPQSRSMLLVPILKGRDDVPGLILLESDRLNAFSETDGHFVTQIANQAVVAVSNTQLFQRIREARDNMAVMLNAMEEAIILIDDSGTIAQANPRVNLIGLAPDDVLGQAVETLLDNPALNFAQRLGFTGGEGLRRLLRDLATPDDWEKYEPHTYEFKLPSGDVRYIQRQIIPIEDDDRRVVGALLVFYNKTEERELARARDMFSQMLVHDLRSPLTAVTTSLRLLEELVPDESEFRPLVEKTTGGSRRALRKVLHRVDSLLDISRMESGEMYLDREPAHLKPMLDNVRQELQPLADDLDVRIINDLQPDLPLLHVDSDKVERMLLNLVDNALKYTPPEQHIHVRAALDGGEFLRVEVADRGPGIPDEYKKRLFNRFVQVEGRRTIRRGVGLGLAFCKMVVDAHGGDIWIEDNPGGGSIFKATLPVAQVREPVE